MRFQLASLSTLLFLLPGCFFSGSDEQLSPQVTEDAGARPGEDNAGGGGGLPPTTGRPPADPHASVTPDQTQPELTGNPVGGHCRQDADCTTGLSCILESNEVFGGSIVNGLCTADCSAQPSVCDNLVLPASCYGSETEAYCLQLCQVGDLAIENDGIKCASVFPDDNGEPFVGPRPNQLCLPMQEDGLGLCIPMCLGDSSCGEGSFCNEATGACQDEPPEETPIGKACMAHEECGLGICYGGAEGQQGYCTDLCTVTGAALNCGADETAGTPEDPAGAYCLPVGESGFWDPGRCVPSCSVAEDCPNATDWDCVTIEVEDAQSILGGHTGLCEFLAFGGASDAGVPTDSGAEEPAVEEPAVEEPPLRRTLRQLQSRQRPTSFLRQLRSRRRQRLLTQQSATLSSQLRK